MTHEEIRQFLENRSACRSAMDWLGNRDSSQMWAECNRPDWLLWWAGQVVSRHDLVLAACDCAELALRFAPEGEDRPRIAIETARRWARGEATLDEVRDAADAAADAAACTATYADCAAACAAAYAAANAARAAVYAADAAACAATYADCAAADAVDAAVDAAYAAAYAARSAAYAAANAAMCQLIRDRWPECPLPEVAA